MAAGLEIRFLFSPPIQGVKKRDENTSDDCVSRPYEQMNIKAILIEAGLI